MIERMARQSGAEPAAISQAVQTAHKGFYNAVLDHVEARGVHDTDLFGDFIDSDPALSREMHKAVRNLMTGNDLGGFDRLATRFVQSLDKVDPEAVGAALDASGIKHRKVEGAIVMTMPGVGEISYAEAVKLGLIKVSRG